MCVTFLRYLSFDIIGKLHYWSSHPGAGAAARWENSKRRGGGVRRGCALLCYLSFHEGLYYHFCLLLLLSNYYHYYFT